MPRLTGTTTNIVYSRQAAASTGSGRNRPTQDRPGHPTGRGGNVFKARAAMTHKGCATDENAIPPETARLSSSAATPAVVASRRAKLVHGTVSSKAKVANHKMARPLASRPFMRTCSGDRELEDTAGDASTN